MSKLEHARAQIASRMRRGHRFADVEAELIDPSDFSDAEKSALWLYGWSFVPLFRQRREATAHIDRLATGHDLTRPSRIEVGGRRASRIG